MTDQPKPVTVVDMTPTWQESARMLCVILRDGSDEGKAHAEGEIVRMGQIIDRLLAERKAAD